MLGFSRALLLSGLALIFTTLAGATAAHAADSQADCGEVDLRAEFQARTQAPSVRNQTKADWCFAFAAADLLSWHLGREGSPKYFSALDLAESFFENSYPNQDLMALIDTPGSLALAITTGATRGACAETALPDYVNGGWGGIPGFPRMHGEFANAASNPQSMQDLQNYFNRLSTSAITSSAQFGDLLRKQCDAAGREPSRNVQVLSYNKNSSFQKIQGIDKELNRGNLAVMQYRVNFMANAECDRNHTPPWKGMHDTPVMARRWNRNLNQCEYLLRSSWGDGTDFGYGLYCKDLTILPEGYFWVPYRDMLGSIDQTFFINP